MSRPVHTRENLLTCSSGPWASAIPLRLSMLRSHVGSIRALASGFGGESSRFCLSCTTQVSSMETSDPNTSCSKTGSMGHDYSDSPPRGRRIPTALGWTCKGQQKLSLTFWAATSPAARPPAPFPRRCGCSSSAPPERRLRRPPRHGSCGKSSGTLRAAHLDLLRSTRSGCPHSNFTKGRDHGPWQLQLRGARCPPALARRRARGDGVSPKAVPPADESERREAARVPR